MFSLGSSGCAWRAGAVELWFVLGRVGSLRKTARVNLPPTGQRVQSHFFVLPALHSWYLWVNCLICAASPRTRCLLLLQRPVSETFPPKLCCCAGNTESQAAAFGHLPSLCWKNRLLVAVNRLNRNCSLIKGVRSAYSMSRMFWNVFGVYARNNC